MTDQEFEQQLEQFTQDVTDFVSRIGNIMDYRATEMCRGYSLGVETSAFSDKLWAFIKVVQSRRTDATLSL